MSILNFIANYKKKVDAQKEELVRLQKLNDILKEEISKNSKTLYELEHDISFGINDLMSNSADIMDIDNKSVNEGKIQDTLNDYKRLCCQIRLMEKWKKQYQDDLIQAKDNLKSFLSRRISSLFLALPIGSTSIILQSYTPISSINLYKSSNSSMFFLLTQVVTWTSLITGLSFINLIPFKIFSKLPGTFLNDS